MANPTTNYSFAMPQNSDLVKDLPADFEVFGQAVDTQMKTNADAAIAKTIVDAKGDLIAATASDTVSRVAVGTDGQVLLADSTAATGLAWGTPASGGMTLISTTTLTGSSVTLSSISTTYKNLVLIVKSSYATGQAMIGLRLNGDSGAAVYYSNASNYSASYNQTEQTGASYIPIIQNYNTSTDSYLSFSQIVIPQYTDTSGGQLVVGQSYGGTQRNGWNSAAVYNNRTAAITSITVLMSSGSFSAGTVTLYGVK